MGNTMLIEGINSLNANAQPSSVIDDVIMDMQFSREMLHDGYFNNLLANLNVNDIESVQVLKNGTALYGAKGANGVLLIKTKRNKSMATKIDVNINGRYELTPRLPKMMGAEDYRLYTTELLAGKMNPNDDGHHEVTSTATPPTSTTTSTTTTPTGRTRSTTTPSPRTTASTCRAATTSPPTTSPWATRWATAR